MFDSALRSAAAAIFFDSSLLTGTANWANWSLSVFFFLFPPQIPADGFRTEWFHVFIQGTDGGKKVHLSTADLISKAGSESVSPWRGWD